MQTNLQQIKVHIFWEGDKILWNLHDRFVLFSASQIYGGDFAKFCGLLRIYELYNEETTCRFLKKWNLKYDSGFINKWKIANFD